jgi:tyrosine-protein kinase Etk/Wzc
MDSKESRQESVEGTARSQGSVLLDFLAVVTKYRRIVTPFVVLATVVATVITLLVPKWYKATASVFPAEKADLFGALDGVSSLVKSLSPSRALSSLTGNTETDKYTAILKSRTVLDSVIQKFDLVHVYDITSYPIEKTTKELLSNVEFVAEPEGNLTITVFDTDPQRAADMANYFVDMLNKTNVELQVQNARGNKLFIEQRYQKNLLDLSVAEDSMKVFQQRYGVIAMPQQTEASIKAGAELTAQLALREVQQGVLRQTQAADHPAVVAARIEIQELRRKLEQMNSGSLNGPGEMNVFVPFRKVPQMGMEYLRRYREVEIQYKILQFITPLYEQAKVEEKRQTPSVVVLDRAVPAERKAKPKVILWGLIALVGSVLISIFVVFFLEMVEKIQRAQPDRLAAVVSTLRADWFGLRVRKK